MKSPTAPQAFLKERIRQWIEDNPARAHAGERMLEQLLRIQSEFKGDTAAHLESLVAETFHRQLRIDESRRAGLLAARHLSETVQALSNSLRQCLQSVTRANDASLSAAMSAMQVQTTRTSILPREIVDKKLLN